MTVLSCVGGIMTVYILHGNDVKICAISHYDERIIRLHLHVENIKSIDVIYEA